jgi:D-galactarolactone isomerase
MQPCGRRMLPTEVVDPLRQRLEHLDRGGAGLHQVEADAAHDHLAHIPRNNGVEHPAFKTMRKLIDKGHTWVKLSGAYQDTTIGAPTYADATPIAQAYVKAAPERMVWGSD